MFLKYYVLDEKPNLRDNLRTRIHTVTVVQPHQQVLSGHSPSWWAAGICSGQSEAALWALSHCNQYSVVYWMNSVTFRKMYNASPICEYLKFKENSNFIQERWEYLSPWKTAYILSSWQKSCLLMTETVVLCVLLKS